MRIMALIVVAAALAGCASYQPVEANCFNFLPMEDGGDCTFTPLGGPVDG
jgi:hypothetical protein